MNVYASVADGAQSVKGYQRQWVDRLMQQATDAEDAQNLQLREEILLVANQNLQFANDVMGLILKNISQLQP